MKHPDFPFAKASELEDIVRSAQRQELFRAMVAIALTVGVAAFWVHRFYQSVPWFSLALLLGMLFWLLFTNEELRGELVEDAAPEWLGAYTASELHALVEESCRDYEEKEIPNVYILNTTEASAFVLNVDILNFVKRWNAIYLSRHLLHALNREELKAIVDHEMCHFSRWPTFWSRYFYLRALLFSVWVTTLVCYPYEWLLTWTGGGLWFYVLFFVLTLFGVVRFVWRLTVGITSLFVTFIDRPDAQEIEALCDFESAKRGGLLPTVNALLKTGTRSEIFNLVLTRFLPEEVPPKQEETTTPEQQEQHDLKELQREAAAAVALEHLMTSLPMEFLSVSEARPYVEDAIKAGLEAVEAETFEPPPRNTTQWLSFDTNVVDQRLDTVEFEAFVTAIKENPDQPLFDLPDEIDPSEAEEHPPIRNRILFLDYNKASL